jgi:hypothetical protein
MMSIIPVHYKSILGIFKFFQNFETFGLGFAEKGRTPKKFSQFMLVYDYCHYKITKTQHFHFRVLCSPKLYTLAHCFSGLRMGQECCL